MKKNLFTDEKQNQDQVEPENKKETLPTKMINIEEFAASQGVDLPESNFDDSQGELQPQIQKVTVLHQAQQFRMPDESKREELSGVIIGYSMAKAFWEGDRENLTETTPPTCFSFGGVKPDAAPPISDSCHSCQLNMPGSDKKSVSKMGRLCKTKPRIVIYIPGSVFPVLLSLSPTAIKPLSSYMSALESKKQRFYSVITKITLSEVKKGSYLYSIPEFESLELPEYFHNDVDSINRLLENVIDLRKNYNKYKEVQITADEEGAGAPESTDGEPF